METRQLTPDENLGRYIRETRRFPLLSVEQERDYARRWRDGNDREALRQLVGSHLRLVIKMARGVSGYAVPMCDLVSQGNLGLMQAAEKFDPDRGVRFATYAAWWIRAAMQDYVIRSRSLVRMGTTAAQKKLYFNLSRLKGKLHVYGDGELSPETAGAIARELGVPEADVLEMNRRLAVQDSSLNAVIDSNRTEEWQDALPDTAPNPESLLAETEEFWRRRELMAGAMEALTVRERHILKERKLRDDPPTLQDLSIEYGISRERVRQIEARAFSKLQAAVRTEAARVGLWKSGRSGSYGPNALTAQ